MNAMSRFGFALVLGAMLSTSAQAADTGELIGKIQSVGKRGAGHDVAAIAVKQLQKVGVEAAIPILNAMDDANPLAFNWLQVAFESVVDSAIKDGSVSAKDLEAFALDRTHHGRSRRVAFDWLVKCDATATERLIPQMLDDPSGPLRREAVARIIEQAKESISEEVELALWQKALTGAVDKDQVDEIAKALGKLDQPVNLVQHFGLLTEWSVIGPFDNTDMKAFDVAYPPEKELDFDAEYQGKDETVKWESFSSKRKDGAFDLAELTAPHKGAVDYAYTEFTNAEDQIVEFRLATANAWKLWVNGKLVFAREEYHRGMQFDQYIVRGEIKQGKNTFLMKVCQNEQEQDWAQRWAFQFRIVDDSGRAVADKGQGARD